MELGCTVQEKGEKEKDSGCKSTGERVWERMKGGKGREKRKRSREGEKAWRRRTGRDEGNEPQKDKKA